MTFGVYIEELSSQICESTTKQNLHNNSHFKKVSDSSENDHLLIDICIIWTFVVCVCEELFFAILILLIYLQKPYKRHTNNDC